MAITKTKATTKCHIMAVMNDPEYIEEYNKLTNHPDKNKLLPDLLKRFGLELEDVNLGERNNGFALYANPYTMFSVGDLEYIENRKEFVASFNADIKKEQFDKLWDLIKKNQDRIGIQGTKPKAPLNGTLLYAVFKARKNHLTFPNIFRLYQDKQLPYYDKGSDSQYKSDDSLARYYRKYYKADT